MKWLPEPERTQLQPPVRRDRVGLVDAVVRLELVDARLAPLVHATRCTCRPTAGRRALIRACSSARSTAQVGAR